MMALDRASEAAAHWSEQRYQELFREGADAVRRLVLVAESAPELGSMTGTGKSVLGFLVAQHLSPEWELENIVVASAARRMGIGRQFVEALLEEARRVQSESLLSESVFLEVRESNTAARALYETTGFQQVGRRKSYYSAPPEDAILYRWNLRTIS